MIEKVPPFDTRNVDALMAADEVMRYCNYCGQSFESVQGNLERLCPDCRED
jgi:NADH pyrophosphatase NudC (nudix superfamily)